MRIRIRIPGSGAFLTPGSGIRDGEKSGIRNENPSSFFQEHRTVLRLKILFNFLPWIRDGKYGSRINIPDP
jgi:hypothetical protein